MHPRKKDIPAPHMRQALALIERQTDPLTSKASDYLAGAQIAAHRHSRHQLIHALSGVMVVHADHGHWVVPPSRGLWMPAGITHSIRCIGPVQMRSLFIDSTAAPQLLQRCAVVGIGALLRELIRAAMEIACGYQPDSRDGRLMQLLLDELHALPVLPLHLPLPGDPRIQPICARLQLHPDDQSTLTDWSAQLRVHSKTIQRLFIQETGLTFGQWRQQARLLRALELLAGGEKVIDIALSLGYDSPSAFSAMFRQQLGQPPSQFFGRPSVATEPAGSI